MTPDRPGEFVGAYVGLGSNLGDRVVYLRQAVARLASHPCVCVRSASRLMETPPVGPPQGPYLNAAVALDTTLGARRLLGLCHRIESAGRRQRRVHWGPRTIDLDVIDYGGLVEEAADLWLPHPALADRAFVLAPLKDVAPGWRHPVTGDSVDALLGRLDDAHSAVTVVADADAWCPPGLMSRTR